MIWEWCVSIQTQAWQKSGRWETIQWLVRVALTWTKTLCRSSRPLSRRNTSSLSSRTPQKRASRGVCTSNSNSCSLKTSRLSSSRTLAPSIKWWSESSTSINNNKTCRPTSTIMPLLANYLKTAHKPIWTSLWLQRSRIRWCLRVALRRRPWRSLRSPAKNKCSRCSASTTLVAIVAQKLRTTLQKRIAAQILTT